MLALSLSSIDWGIPQYGGLRTVEDQAALYTAGKSKKETTKCRRARPLRVAAARPAAPEQRRFEADSTSARGETSRELSASGRRATRTLWKSTECASLSKGACTTSPRTPRRRSARARRRVTGAMSPRAGRAWLRARHRRTRRNGGAQLGWPSTSWPRKGRALHCAMTQPPPRELRHRRRRSSNPTSERARRWRPQVGGHEGDSVRLQSFTRLHALRP